LVDFAFSEYYKKTKVKFSFFGMDEEKPLEIGEKIAIEWYKMLGNPDRSISSHPQAFLWFARALDEGGVLAYENTRNEMLTRIKKEITQFRLLAEKNEDDSAWLKKVEIEILQKN